MSHPASIFEQFPRLLDEMFVASYDFEHCWTKMNPQGSYEDLDVAAALIATQGNVGATAKLLGRSRRSVMGYVHRNLQLKDLQEDLMEEFLDVIEDRHKTAALNGDLATQRFFLTTLGKNRGYTSRSEVTGKDGEAMEQTIKVTADMPDEFLERLLQAADGGS